MSDDIIKRLREAPPETPIYHFADEITALLDRLDAAERENEGHRQAHASIFRALGQDANPDRATWAETITALAADARRYRWLRGREDGRYMTVYAFRTDVDEVCLGAELDAAIDAAMAAEQSDERREG